MVSLSYDQYRDKVYGGWLGRLVGTALGAPMDGQKQMQDLQGPPEIGAGSALVRGKIDFQLLWLRALQNVGPKITADDLIATWLEHINYTEGEMCPAQANFRKELRPPLSGVYDNAYRESSGAMARAEVWGMAAAGDPELAARYTRQDAMLDHAGPGVEAAIAAAAMVSAAFVESDPSKLIEAGISLLPENSKVSRALRDAIRWHQELDNWRRTREMLLRAYGSEDARDATLAISIVATALLQGKGDLGVTLITAGNCGWNTACTCALAGAIIGITTGASALPTAWRAAAPNEVRVGWGMSAFPQDIQCAILTERTCEVGSAVLRSESSGRVRITEEPTEEASTLIPAETIKFVQQLAMGPYVISYQRDPLEVLIDYNGQPTLGYDLPRRLAISIANVKTRSLELRTRISAPAGFVVTTNAEPISLPEGGAVSFNATISAPTEHAHIAVVNPCTLLITIEDGLQVMVPITLVGEALWYAAGPYGSFEEAHAPEQEPILSGQAPLGGAGWQRLSVAEPAVNILAALNTEPGTHYLAADLLLPRARRARLHVATNDGMKTWLNGKEVWHHHEHRPLSPLSANEFEVDLREGWNRLVIKLAQCSPRRFLAVVIKDLDGHALVEAVNTTARYNL